jgi:MurNAc alpha-1-phosphate uridylyltransferase
VGANAMRAMILAAGRGERLRPLTDCTPKPLLEVGGKALIIHHLEALAAAGIREVVINIGYLGDAIMATLGERHGPCRIRYSDERGGILETGGAIVHALPLLGDGPFLLVNADIFTDFPRATLLHRDDRPAHLVLVPNPPQHPQGDFALRGGRVALDVEHRHTYAGIARLHTDLFRPYPALRAPLAPWLRQWIAAGQVSGSLYRGMWLDVGTMERLQTARARYTEK